MDLPYTSAHGRAFDNLPLTARERQAVRARFERAGSAKGRPADDAPWPERLPPFLDDALLEAPDGRLVLARTPTAANPGNRYVFIERTGRVGATLELPPTERVVGFGAATVYTVVQDDDGLERLARYRWP